MARYKQLGDWIRACYTTPVAATKGAGMELTVSVGAGTTVDRAVIQEDQAYGELVRGYTLAALLGGAWREVGRGTAVGNKRIDVGAGGVQATAVHLTITNAVDTPQILFFGVYDSAHC